jgi:hypothetical protein
MTQEFTEQLAKWEMHLHQLGYRKVVLCKDCTKYKHWECPIEQAGYRPKEDGYCFDAERKTGNE